MSRRKRQREDEDHDYDVDEEVDDEDEDAPVSTVPRPGKGKKWVKLNAALQGDDEFSFSSVAPDRRKKPPTNIRPEQHGRPEENRDQRGFFVRVMRKIFAK